MANLRTNNLSGEQGQNAYRGSVFFHGDMMRDYLTISTLPNQLILHNGTGDFTVEFWLGLR